MECLFGFKARLIAYLLSRQQKIETESQDWSRDYALLLHPRVAHLAKLACVLKVFKQKTSGWEDERYSKSGSVGKTLHLSLQSRVSDGAPPAGDSWRWFPRDSDLEAVKEVGCGRERCLAAAGSAVALGNSCAEMALLCCPASQRQGCWDFLPAHGLLT